MHCSTRRGRRIIAAARLPPSVAKFCQRYVKKHKISKFYEKKYDAKSEEFWKFIELPNKATTKDIES